MTATTHTKKFPHFLRIISALGLLFILGLVTLNLLHSRLYGFDEGKMLKQQIMSDPNESALHEKLGQYYLPFNKNEAEKEYQLASEFYQILGAQTTPADIWNNITTESERLENELVFWEKVNSLYPDYEYAQLKMAVINYQLGNKNQAQAIINKLLFVSPNNTEAKKIQEKIKGN